MNCTVVIEGLDLDLKELKKIVRKGDINMSKLFKGKIAVITRWDMSSGTCHRDKSTAHLVFRDVSKEYQKAEPVDVNLLPEPPQDPKY